MKMVVQISMLSIIIFSFIERQIVIFLYVDLLLLWFAIRLWNRK